MPPVWNARRTCWSWNAEHPCRTRNTPAHNQSHRLRAGGFSCPYVPILGVLLMMNHLSFVMFLSPFPVRGATDAMPHRWGGSYISIHAPRAGNDSFLDRFSLMSEYFNPRSPCGERQHKYTFFKCIFMKKNLEFVIYSSLYVISCRGQQRLSTSSYKYPCEPIQILMYASASLYRISGSSGRYVCLQPKCSILSS